MTDLSIPISVELLIMGDGQMSITASTYYHDRDLALTRIEAFYMLFPDKVLTRRVPEVETNNGISKASCRFIVNEPPPGPVLRKRLNIVSTTFGTAEVRE